METRSATDYQYRRLLLGLLYGLCCGLVFSIFAWGLDAVQLARANSSYSFLKFLLGLLICLPVGAWVGRTTIQHSSHALALLLWVGLAVAFSWLVVWLPLDGWQEILKELDPSLFPLMHYREVANIWQYRIFVIFILGLASTIAGLLEINLVEQALHNAYGSGIITMIVVTAIIYGMAGSATDYFVNSNLREPVVTLNNLIQFGRENSDKEVPAEIARKMHLSTLNQIRDLLDKPYQMTIIGYDRYLGQIEILVKFGEDLVKCTTIYAQPTNCVPLNTEASH